MTRSTLGGFAASAVVALVLLVVLCREANEPPPPRVTCRDLAADPDAYAGRVVRLDTAGCQPEDGRLVWRRMAGDRPAVVVTFAGNGLPDPVPAEVVGLVRPEPDGPVRVVRSRPAHP